MNSYSVNPKSVLEGLSKNNLKHSAKHLTEFVDLDATLTADKVRQIGASLVKPENLVSRLNSSQKVFQGNVNIGGKQVTVRTVLNRLDRLHSVHIRR